jgi:threonine dehydrogenase-like Zn-dependent dehydrogenase
VCGVCGGRGGVGIVGVWGHSLRSTFQTALVATLDTYDFLITGLDIIEETFVDAAEKYREVLRIIEEYKAKIKTDTLQRLHTVTNLAELLESGHEGKALFR